MTRGKTIHASLARLLLADKQKSAVLGALLIVLALSSGRMLVGRGPARASASEERALSGREVAEAGQQAVSRTVASLNSLRSGKPVVIRIGASADRDVFALDPAHFPSAAQPAQPNVAKDTAVESRGENADETAADARAQVVMEISGWVVRGVVTGAEPSAVIQTPKPDAKRTLVRIGQELQGWKAVGIASDGVVLEKQGIRVRLKVTTDR